MTVLSLNVERLTRKVTLTDGKITVKDKERARDVINPTLELKNLSLLSGKGLYYEGKPGDVTATGSLVPTSMIFSGYQDKFRVYEQAPVRRRFVFKTSTEKTPISTIIWTPWLYYCISFHRYYILASATQLKSINDSVVKPLLSNIEEDGSICLNKKINIKDPTILAHTVIKTFWSRKFNEDLLEFPFNDIFTINNKEFKKCFKDQGLASAIYRAVTWAIEGDDWDYWDNEIRDDFPKTFTIAGVKYTKKTLAEMLGCKVDPETIMVHLYVYWLGSLTLEEVLKLYSVLPTYCKLSTLVDDMNRQSLERRLVSHAVDVIRSSVKTVHVGGNNLVKAAQ